MLVSELPSGCSCLVLHELGEMNVYGDHQSSIPYPHFVKHLKKLFEKSRENYKGDLYPECRWYENTAFFIAYTGQSQSQARKNLKKIGFVTTRNSHHRKMEETREMDFRLHFMRSDELYKSVCSEYERLVAEGEIK